MQSAAFGFVNLGRNASRKTELKDFHGACPGRRLTALISIFKDGLTNGGTTRVFGLFQKFCFSQTDCLCSETYNMSYNLYMLTTDMLGNISQFSNFRFTETNGETNRTAKQPVSLLEGR